MLTLQRHGYRDPLFGILLTKCDSHSCITVTHKNQKWHLLKYMVYNYNIVLKRWHRNWKVARFDSWAGLMIIAGAKGAKWPVAPPLSSDGPITDYTRWLVICHWKPRNLLWKSTINLTEIWIFHILQLYMRVCLLF